MSCCPALYHKTRKRCKRGATGATGQGLVPHFANFYTDVPQLIVSGPAQQVVTFSLTESTPDILFDGTGTVTLTLAGTYSFDFALTVRADQFGPTTIGPLQVFFAILLPLTTFGLQTVQLQQNDEMVVSSPYVRTVPANTQIQLRVFSPTFSPGTLTLALKELAINKIA
jgi:hypothetical protein